MALCEDFCAVEWNWVSGDLRERDNEVILYSNKTGEMVGELKLEDNDPNKRLWMEFIEIQDELFIVLVHQQIEVYRIGLDQNNVCDILILFHLNSDPFNSHIFL